MNIRIDIKIYIFFLINLVEFITKLLLYVYLFLSWHITIWFSKGWFIRVYCFGNVNLNTLNLNRQYNINCWSYWILCLWIIYESRNVVCSYLLWCFTNLFSIWVGTFIIDLDVHLYRGFWTWTHIVDIHKYPRIVDI